MKLTIKALGLVAMFMHIITGNAHAKFGEWVSSEFLVFAKNNVALTVGVVKSDIHSKVIAILNQDGWVQNTNKEEQRKFVSCKLDFPDYKSYKVQCLDTKSDHQLSIYFESKIDEFDNTLIKTITTTISTFEEASKVFNEKQTFSQN